MFELPAERPLQVVGIGVNAVDLFARVPRLPEPDEKLEVCTPFARYAGGQVATALVTCARMGLSTRYLGKIGDDEAGQFARQALVDEGVDVSQLRVVAGASTQQAMILVDARTGERTIIYHRDAATRFRAGDYRPELVTDAQVLHLDGHREIACSIEAAHWAHEAGMAVVMDAEKVIDGTAELLPLVDFLLCSEKFPTRMTGKSDPEQALEELARGPHTLVAMTLGRRGSLALHRGRTIRSPGHTVATVDTTGAGDVFHGAFIVGLIRGWSAARTLDFANAAAALSCRAVGGQSALPSQEQALKLLE